MVGKLTSKDNSIIKQLRSLSLRKNRTAQRMFVIEGIKLLHEALQSGAAVMTILVSDEHEDILGDNDIAAYLDTFEVYMVPGRIFDSIADTRTPQGVLASVRFPASYRELCYKDDLKTNLFNSSTYNGSGIGSGIYLILEDIQDPANVGGMIRTADAFACNAVIVSNSCADVFNHKTVRASMGSIFHLPIIISDDLLRTVADMKSAGIKVVAAAPDSGHKCVDADMSVPVAIAVGNESSGLSEALMASADIRLRIPMPGCAESLNASTAAAVLIYEAYRQLHNTFRKL